MDKITNQQTMIEIKQQLTGGKNSIEVVGSPCILQLYDTYLKFSVKYTETKYKDEEDQYLGTEDNIVGELSYYRKDAIHQVSAAYWNKEGVWFVKLATQKDALEINVESEERAYELVEIIQKWLFK